MGVGEPEEDSSGDEFGLESGGSDEEDDMTIRTEECEEAPGGFRGASKGDSDEPTVEEGDEFRRSESPDLY